MSRPTITPADAVAEVSALGRRIAEGAKLFGEIRDTDVQIATTPKDLVWSQDKVSLYRYRPLAESKGLPPVLIVYGLIGRYTMADLQEDRSLVRNLLNLGLDLYVVDWGNPLGICEGGVFTTCYAALYPEQVNAMVLTITPIDFHADQVDNRPGHGFINLWMRSLSPEDIDRLIESQGSLPGAFMGSVFSMMTPMRTLTKYNLDLLDALADKKKFLNFLRMEKWIADRPDHPGEAAKQWLKDLYQDNKLVENRFALSGRTVKLSDITCPVLNVYAKDDHIIPPATSRALGGKIGTQDYTELGLPGGHVGVFVGGKAQALLGSGIADWLGARG